MFVFDIVIIGGSLGGTLAAYQSAKSGKRVALVESTDWIGGQLTSQAVPPDEHPWIESFGCTELYRLYRQRVREFYANTYGLQEGISLDKLNPGNGWVSRLCHEPNVAHDILREMLNPFTQSGLITLFLEHDLLSVETQGSTIVGVTIQDKKDTASQLKAKVFIDATDQGDMLPLIPVAYSVGAEGHAGDKALLSDCPVDSGDLQPVTWVCALEQLKSPVEPIKKPELYEYYKKIKTIDNKPLLSAFIPDSTTMRAKKIPFFQDPQGLDLWRYRRVFDPKNFIDSQGKGEISLINWPQNDYILGNIIEVDSPEEHMARSRELTLSLVYYLQTEVLPVSLGYNTLQLHGLSVGTDSGLAKSPYIREGRRLKSLYTLSSQDLMRKGNEKSKKFYDSVGLGSYHLDLHCTTGSNTYLYAEIPPFEIPLGIFLSNKFTNFIPGSKNVGTTHISNSALRVHPCEWNIGEVSGLLATFLLDYHIPLQDIYSHLSEFQQRLRDAGIPLHWPENIGNKD